MATLYYKIVGSNTIYSYCKSIRTANGVISKPSAEQIAAEGWQVYVPPVVPPVPQSEPYTNDILDAVKRMLSTETEELTDEEALDVAALFPTWSSKLPKDGEVQGEAVVAGERLWDDGKLWKVVQTHNVMPNWRPADTPALFVEVSFVEWPEIPENIPSTAPWRQGDKGTWKGQHYICKQDNCTWNPDQYPAAWELQP